MKKLISALLCLCLMLSFTACSIPGGTGGTAVCQHRDVNDDSLCDKCSESYTDGKDIPDAPVCQHRDADDNGICTVCGEPLAPTIGIVYDISVDGTYAKVIGYTGTATKILIAETYEGLPVKVIYDEAFRNNDTIKQVVIPNSVETIGYRAFYFCDALTSVMIGNSVKSIGNEAFDSCYSLTSVTIGNSVKSIGWYAFSGCSRLTSVTIPDSVTSIGYGAFSRCSSLTSVTIGNSVTSIGSCAFQNCSKLASVTIPNSVTWIGSSAFYRCTSLASVTIGNAAAVIESDAFYDCHSSLYTEYEFGRYAGDAENPYAILYAVTNKNLSTYKMHEDTKIIAYGAFSGCARMTSIAISDGVRSIGYGAFENCSSLTSVTIPDSVTSIGNGAFWNCSSLTSVYYKGDAAEWNAISIGNYNENLTSATRYYYSEEAPTEAGRYWHYDADGKVAVW